MPKEASTHIRAGRAKILVDSGSSRSVRQPPVDSGGHCRLVFFGVVRFVAASVSCFSPRDRFLFRMIAQTIAIGQCRDDLNRSFVAYMAAPCQDQVNQIDLVSRSKDGRGAVKADFLCAFSPRRRSDGANGSSET